MDSTIAEIIRSFDINDYLPLIKRELSLGEPAEPKRGNLVSVVTGIRRSGKTYRLFQEIQQLSTARAPKPNILYFNFEDDRLKPFSTDLGSRVLETYFLMNPDARTDGAYLFLDEIQVVPDWELWLRRVVDTEKVTLFVTGSSAKLLSKDIATAFRGRALSHEMTPLSFSEFVRASGVDLPMARASDKNEGQASITFSAQQRSRLAACFLEYLDKGGFPATLGLQPEHSTMLLQDYVSKVVAKDIVQRHELGNPKVADLFAHRVVTNSSRELSIRKTENMFRSLGITTSRAFLTELLDYLIDSFLIQTVSPFARALSDNPRSAVKVYAVDPGLVRAVSPSSATDIGQRLECVVYAELRRRTKVARPGAVALYRTQNAHEVDFIVGDALSQEGLALYQVSQSLAEKTVQKRELRALAEAMQEKSLDRATVITLNEEESIAIQLQDGRRASIELVPAWKWCLMPAAATAAAGM